MDQETQAQMVDLQRRLAEQENSIDTLSDTVHQHWQKIVELSNLVEQMRGRMLTLEGNVETVLPGDPPPPHY